MCVCLRICCGVCRRGHSEGGGAGSVKRASSTGRTIAAEHVTPLSWSVQIAGRHKGYVLLSLVLRPGLLATLVSILVQLAVCKFWVVVQF